MQRCDGRLVRLKEPERRGIPGGTVECKSADAPKQTSKTRRDSRDMQYRDHLREVRRLMVREEERDDLLDVEFMYSAFRSNVSNPHGMLCGLVLT